MDAQNAGVAAALAVRVFPTTMGFKVTSGFNLLPAASPTSPFDAHSTSTEDTASPLACTAASTGELGPCLELLPASHSLDSSEAAAEAAAGPPLSTAMSIADTPHSPPTPAQADECYVFKQQAAPSRSTSTSFISHTPTAVISQAAAAAPTEFAALPVTPVPPRHSFSCFTDKTATSAPTPTALPGCSSLASNCSVTSGSQGCPWVRAANDFHSSSQLAVPAMLTPPSQQKHVGWEGLLAFSKASGCSGVVAGAHSLANAHRQHRSSMDHDIAPFVVNPAVRQQHSFSSAPSPVPAQPDEPCKVEICCTAHPSEAARRLLKSVARGLKSCQDPEAIKDGMGGAYFCFNEKGRKTAILKPCDEEALAPNNPKGAIGKNLGDPGWKPTVRVGEAAMREVAAFLLDHDGFANVPTSVLVRARHPVFCYRSKMPSVGSSMLDLAGAASAATAVSDATVSDAVTSDNDSGECGGEGEDGVSAELARVSNCSSSAHAGSTDRDSPNLVESISRGSPCEADSMFWRPSSLSRPQQQPAMRTTAGFPVLTATVAVGFSASQTTASSLAPVPARLPRPVSSGLLSLGAASFDTSRMSGSLVARGLAELRAVTSSRAPASPEILPMKLASLQEFISHECDTGEVGDCKFSVSDVHRIGILDIRLFNTDRHSGNMLCVPNSAAGRPGQAGTRSSGATEGPAPPLQQHGLQQRQGYSLVPIDHGFCLPEALEAVYFEWQHWAQTSIPFSEEELAYIERLDVQADKDLLSKELPTLRAECLRVMEVSTTLLKMCATAGLTLYDVAGIMERQLVDGREETSGLELACAAAKLHLEERASEESDSDGEDFDAAPMDHTACSSVGMLQPADAPAPVPKDRDSSGQHMEDMLFDLDDDAAGHAALDMYLGSSRAPRTPSGERPASLSSSVSSVDCMSPETHIGVGGSSRQGHIPQAPGSTNVSALRGGSAAGGAVAHSVHLSEVSSPAGRPGRSRIPHPFAAPSRAETAPVRPAARRAVPSPCTAGPQLRRTNGADTPVFPTRPAPHAPSPHAGYLRRNVTGVGAASGKRGLAAAKPARKSSAPRKSPSPVTPLSAEALKAIFSDMEEPTWVRFMASLRGVLRAALDSGVWKQSTSEGARAMSCPG
ncbi:MAG: hypothetical protein WDW36_004489 [Sanguina aurantia]